MEPTQQGVVPFNFWQGIYATGSYDLSFSGDFDLLITSIMVSPEAESAQPFVDFGVSSSEYIFSREVNSAAAEFPPPEIYTPMIVLVEPTALVLQVAVASARVSIDGFLLKPSGAGFY
jgi:hypothetical protein